ncbi:MAG: hypothetical protein R3F65_11090 [bacterium]
MSAAARLAPLLTLAVVCLAPPAHALDPLAARGRAVVEAAQCNRCHAISGPAGLGIAPAERAQNCVTCHQWILGTKGDPAAIARQRETFPDWDRYLDSIVHFRRLPDLGTLTRRVDPAFVRAFLDAPFDLRPHLDESMIPLRLSAADKDAVVAWLVALNGAAAVAAGAARVEGAVDAARVEAGRAQFVASGCATCHVVGDRPLVPGFDAGFFRAVGEAAALAPDLRHVRRRVPRAVLVRFIVDPAAVDPQTAMPKMGVAAADAEKIADFLLHGPVESGPVAVAVAEIPVLARKVGYDEVFDEVLGKICVHCHMAPESNDGDGGAGNTGGLGFGGVSLDLESWAGIERGLLRDGKRVSVLRAPAPGEPPLLLAALLRRQREAARDHRPVFGGHDPGAKGPDPARPGMPLGLPPLSVAQLSVVKTWLAQGAPGPAR